MNSVAVTDAPQISEEDLTAVLRGDAHPRDIAVKQQAFLEAASAANAMEEDFEMLYEPDKGSKSTKKDSASGNRKGKKAKKD